MRDLLEQFIINNRDAFDEAKPSDRVWKAIRRKVERRSKFLHLSWKAAAVLFMITTLTLLLDKNFRREEPQLPEEFIQVESYYTRLIDNKRREVEGKLSRKQQETLLAEIDQLDEMYLELKENYQINAANTRLVDAMINNLQIRLDILVRQLEILEDIRKKSDEMELDMEV